MDIVIDILNKRIAGLMADNNRLRGEMTPQLRYIDSTNAQIAKNEAEIEEFRAAVEKLGGQGQRI